MAHQTKCNLVYWFNRLGEKYCSVAILAQFQGNRDAKIITGRLDSSGGAQETGFFRIPEYKMESSEEKEERNKESFLIFTRVRTSKGIDKKSFKLTVVALSCYPGKEILNCGKMKRKLSL